MTDNATKTKILESMYTLVAEKGYDKTSIGQIAEAVGIQKPSVYYYFKSKEDIFMGLVRALYQDNYGEKRAIFGAEMTPQAYQDALVAIGENFIDTYFAHQTLRKVYAEIDLQSTRIPALKEFIGGNEKRFNRFLLDCMERGVALGAVPQGFDAPLNAQILYTALIGIDQAILYDLPITPKAVWRTLVTKLLDGRAQI